MGRPPLTEEQVRAKVLAYCERYHVSPGPEGLPPFPSGKRESRQHREWLTVYRAHHRSRKRSAVAEPSASTAAAGGSCPICARPLQTDLLHPACAELVRVAEAAGPEALARVGRFLWPGGARGASRPRPPRG
jgi:hypothetical protein